MHVLFIHQAFPAQFGRLALELVRAHGWRCTFLVDAISTCPAPMPEMLDSLELLPLRPPEARVPAHQIPWPQTFGDYLQLCDATFDALRRRPELKPDLVVAHGGRGAPTLFLPEIVDGPIINYCEYYFATCRSDLTYRADLPPVEELAPFFPRCINAPALAGLTVADSGYSATRWQRDTFPERFRPRIEVHFDGIDTDLYRPKPAPRRLGDRPIPEGTKIVTFVSRGLESIRGFDLLLRVAERIARQRPDVVFAVVGSDQTYYGWDPLFTGGRSFREVAETATSIDAARLVYLGHLTPEALADLLAISDLHLYLTVPFVLSWSMLNAMASGCVVLGSDVPPVREAITPGLDGLIEPLFDVDRLVAASLRVLDHPAEFEPIRRAARQRILDAYSLEVCIPRLKDYFERVAAAGVTRDRLA